MRQTARRSVRSSALLFAGLVLLAQPASAINVQQMKQRLNNAVNRPEDILTNLSQQIICKADKKPICYCEAVFIDTVDKTFAITKVTRPEANKAYYILFKNRDGSFKPIYSRTMDLLNLAKWKADKVMIPDPVAQRLISKMQPLR